MSGVKIQIFEKGLHMKIYPVLHCVKLKFTESDIACNVCDVEVQVPLQNCECQFKRNQPCWVTQPLNCIYLEQFIQNPLLLHRNLNLTLMRSILWLLFYVTSVTEPFCSISLIEISQSAKLYSSVNMSAGTNMFITGKLDSSCLYSVCAKIKVWKLSLNVTSATVELPCYKITSMHAGILAKGFFLVLFCELHS